MKRRRELRISSLLRRRLFRSGQALGIAFTISVVFIQSQAVCGTTHQVPDWARKAVWYQVFPERFRNGDQNNDPTFDDIQGAWPHEAASGWRISPWTADWYKLQPWEEPGNKGFYFRAQQRRYGGDLQGVLDKLEYLQSLGVNAIYLNPIFESPSLHKYDASTFHHVDNNFGPDPADDCKIWAGEQQADPGTWKWTAADKLFLQLLREAHRKSIKIIIDGVFHCTGSTFWAFEDLKKNQRQSQFREWYDVKRWDDPATPEDEFDYEGWFGVRELPELRETQNSLAQGPKEYIHAIVKRWMDPNGDGDPSDGVDGWRLDAAEMAPAGFWVEFRGWVKAINPDAYLTGELWWEDWANDRMYNASSWLRGDTFDAVMNYRWAREVIRFFVGDTTGITPSEFDRRLRELRNDYPADVNYVLMNLLDSHDTDRLGSMIVNVDSRYDHNIGVADNRNYNVRKPGADEVRIQKLIALFQMTYLGAPMVYYGDEVGMWGADDPDERKPMLWSDMVYEDESHHPYGLVRPVDRNKPDIDLRAWYEKLISIRRSHAAFSLGDIMTLASDDANGIYAFRRSHESEHIVVVINNARVARDVAIRPGEDRGGWRSVLNGTVSTVDDGVLKLRLQPKTGEVLLGVDR